jgi:hypothetical protein
MNEPFVDNIKGGLDKVKDGAKGGLDKVKGGVGKVTDVVGNIFDTIIEEVLQRGDQTDLEQNQMAVRVDQISPLTLMLLFHLCRALLHRNPPHPHGSGHTNCASDHVPNWWCRRRR